MGAVIEYSGQLPDAVLEGKINDGEFIPAETLRGIISSYFPKTQDEEFHGLDYICLGEIYLKAKSEFRRYLEQFGRDKTLKHFVPQLWIKGAERNIRLVNIVESQFYMDDCEDDCPFKKYIWALELTKEGYKLKSKELEWSGDESRQLVDPDDFDFES